MTPVTKVSNAVRVARPVLLGAVFGTPVVGFWSLYCQESLQLPIPKLSQYGNPAPETPTLPETNRAYSAGMFVLIICVKSFESK